MIIPTAYQIALQNARKATTEQLRKEVRQKRRVRVKAVGRPVSIAGRG